MRERNSQPEIKNFVPIMLRLPKDLHERMKKAAEKEHRSLNAQAIVLIENALGENDDDPRVK